MAGSSSRLPRYGSDHVCRLPSHVLQSAPVSHGVQTRFRPSRLDGVWLLEYRLVVHSQGLRVLAPTHLGRIVPPTRSPTRRLAYVGLSPVSSQLLDYLVQITQTRIPMSHGLLLVETIRCRSKRPFVALMSDNTLNWPRGWPVLVPLHLRDHHRLPRLRLERSSAPRSHPNEEPRVLRP